MIIDVNEQKIGIVVSDDPTNHLPRMYAMKIVVGDRYSYVHVLDAERGGKRTALRKEKAATVDVCRVAREQARKFKILRQSIEVQYENAKSKTKTAK